MPPLTPHPSRSAPKCVDCVHYRDSAFHSPKCDHPTVPRNVVTGEAYIACIDLRRPLTPGQIEAALSYCGPAGDWFQPRG